MSGPLPTPRPMHRSTDDLNRQFWQHCAKGALYFQRCLDCEIWRHMPRYVRPMRLRQMGVERIQRQRKNFFLDHHPPGHAPQIPRRNPYAALVVEMDEGVRFVSRPLGIANEDLAIDMPVQVVFETIEDGFALPLFRRA